MNLAIIIPARGGSTRIPRKNLTPLAGRPLIDYTFDLVRQAHLTNQAWVSTEDDEIAAHTRAAGFQVISRPSQLAAHDTPTETVLLHALDHLPAIPDWIMTLPPTSPFRTPATLDKALVAAREAPPETDSIMTVTPTLGDYWQIKGGQWHRLFPKAPRTQQARAEGGWALYEENSALYLTRVAALQKHAALAHPAPILGETVMALSIPLQEALDINTKHDLKLADYVLSENH